MPADPAFRGMGPQAAGKYGETLGLAEPEARALEASLQEAVDLAAGADAGGQIDLSITRSGQQLEMAITAGGTTTTLSRGLA